MRSTPATETDPVAALTALLIDAFRGLGAAGQPEGASRLAGRAPCPPPDPQLDVRTEPPARRHELIFDTYEQLDACAGFVLVNDHDPKPLQYQFAAEHAGQFSWDYLEQGPEVWRVRIGRTGSG